MPLSKYFGGHGPEVMRDMQKRYGKRGESVFYATANKRKAARPTSRSSSRPKR